MRKFFLLVITGCLLVGMYWGSPYRQTAKQPTVQLVTPQIHTIQDTITLYGKVVDPHRQKVFASGNSQVLEVFVSEGETVRKGQPLMRLRRLEPLQGKQAATASALIQLRDTLESGAIEDAENMLQDMVQQSSVQHIYSEEMVYDLFSPCSGIVMKLSATEGEEVSSLLPCLEITDTSRLQIEAAAGEDIVGMLTADMACTIQIPAFSLDGIPGEILQIAPYAQETGFFTGSTAIETSIRIAPASHIEQLRPGYSATAKIILSVRENAVLIPYEAVSQDDVGNEYVLKLENNHLVKANILTGSELSEQVEITQGLSAGDLIVMEIQPEWEGERIVLASD